MRQTRVISAVLRRGSSRTSVEQYVQEGLDSSFLEFGADLSREELWTTLFISRSSLVAELDGGMAQVFKILLESIFTGPTNPAVGLLLKGADSSHLKLHFCLGMFLQDGGAQKMTFLNKQDGGSRLCQLCKNMFNEASSWGG